MTATIDFAGYQAAEQQAMAAIGRPIWGSPPADCGPPADGYSAAEVEAATLAMTALDCTPDSVLAEIGTLRSVGFALHGIERPAVMEIGGDGRLAALLLAEGFVHLGCEVDAAAYVRTTAVAQLMAPTKLADLAACQEITSGTQSIRLPWWQAVHRERGLAADLVLCRRLPDMPWRTGLLTFIRRSLKSSKRGLLWLAQAESDTPLRQQLTEFGFRPTGVPGIYRVGEAPSDPALARELAAPKPWHLAAGETLYQTQDLLCARGAQ